MLKEYQVTLMCATNCYKPVSCIIKKDDSIIAIIGATAFTKEIQTAGIVKICQQRRWTNRDLKQYGYTRVKIREYDKEKIEQENKERYEKIKEEKYNSGEWKRPRQCPTKET